MSESKPLASLSPTLLARKGAARPAMRPQWQPLVNYSTEVPLPPEPAEFHPQLEDLGWNDMGDGAAAPTDLADPTVVPFGPGDGPMVEAFSSGPPTIVRQQDALIEQLTEPQAAPAPEPQPEPEPQPAAFAPSPLIPLAAHRLARAAAQSVDRRSALADGRRAAFTLRVDEARHLKLRLACTVQGRSAQQIVTEALDRLLDELPGLDELAKRARRR